MDDVFVLIPKFASIFALAFFYFWPSIPAGLALGLSPLAVILTTSLSYACGAAVVTLLGERVRAWVMHRLGRKAEVAAGGRLRRIWEQYGLIGLGLLAPMTVGAQIGAAMGLALNAQPRRLFAALALGGLIWSAGLTIAVTLGLLGVNAFR